MNPPPKPQPPTPIPPFETCRILVPLDEISYVVSILEGYDNEFLVRTETRGMGILRLWYPESSRGTLDAVLREMATDFPLSVLGFLPGMAGLDEAFSDA